MADKATLLQSVPPVAQKTSAKEPPRPEVKTKASTGIETQPGVETQPAADVSMSSFQAVTYGSFVLTFVLAGFAAVVLFRKALDTAEQRFSRGAKALAAVLALMSMHGFFATYNYTRYLNEETHTAPLSLTVLFWIILGATIGYLTNRLLEPKDKVKTGEVVIDGLFYAGIFILVTLAVSPETNTNVSLILSLIAVILCTVPLARFFIAYKRVKFRHPELQHKSIKRLLYSLIFFPALLPLVALFYVFKAFGPDTTLFCTNLITSGFILYVGFTMLASIRFLKSEQFGSEAAKETTTPTAAVPKTDPLLEELLAEEAAAKAEAKTADKATPAQKIRSVPEKAPQKPRRDNTPKKPMKPQPASGNKGPSKAPKKPDPLGKDSKKPAPNSPSKIKAPAKPKKRF